MDKDKNDVIIEEKHESKKENENPFAKDLILIPILVGLIIAMIGIIMMLVNQKNDIFGEKEKEYKANISSGYEVYLEDKVISIDQAKNIEFKEYSISTDTNAKKIYLEKKSYNNKTFGFMVSIIFATLAFWCFSNIRKE